MDNINEGSPSYLRDAVFCFPKCFIYYINGCCVYNASHAQWIEFEKWAQSDNGLTQLQENGQYINYWINKDLYGLGTSVKPLNDWFDEWATPKTIGCDTFVLEHGRPVDENRWDYLKPYNELRLTLTLSIINEFLSSSRRNIVVEIGGAALVELVEKRRRRYYCFNAKSPYTNFSQIATLKGRNYMLVLFGLLFYGDINQLKQAIAMSDITIMEYSKDGMSMQQINEITKGFKVKMVIPEYFISTDGEAPKECGNVNKRGIIMIDNRNSNSNY